MDADIRLDGPPATPLDTAAAHFTANVPRAEPASLAGDVRRSLLGRSFDSADDVAVCEGDRLVGLVTIEQLLAASDDTPLGEIMDADPPVVAPGIDQEIAAWRMVRHGESSLAVVDERGRFQGLIPPNRMLAVLLQEHEEDMARLGGFLSGATQARTAAEEPVGRRLWHRLPWLGLGLAGAMATAGIVSGFEEKLSEVVLLAVFVPAVVYMADAVGTQTETLVIRGISVGVPVHRVLARELATGTLVGAVIAAAFFPFAYLVWNDADVAAVVALALFAACSTATTAAMGLPYLLHRLGRDPAFGSGPVATVIQDLLSILIYFGIATALT
jgi:magnesium transporter